MYNEGVGPTEGGSSRAGGGASQHKSRGLAGVAHPPPASGGVLRTACGQRGRGGMARQIRLPENCGAVPKPPEASEATPLHMGHTGHHTHKARGLCTRKKQLRKMADPNPQPPPRPLRCGALSGHCHGTGVHSARSCGVTDGHWTERWLTQGAGVERDPDRAVPSVSARRPAGRRHCVARAPPPLVVAPARAVQTVAGRAVRVWQIPSSWFPAGTCKSHSN